MNNPALPQEDYQIVSKKIDGILTQLSQLQAYIDKTLHVACVHSDMYSHKSSRFFYTLDNKWGLTCLSTGQPFFVNTEDRNITPWLIMGGQWETNVDKVLLAYADKNMTFVDIGANMGYYTVKIAAVIGPKGRCFAFEPNPEVSCVCLENIKINGLSSSTTLFPFALGDRKTTARLTRSASNMASANLIAEQSDDFSVEVDVLTLDAALPDNTIVDFIKLDAEGYEKLILDGARQTLSNSPNCAVILELNLDRWEKFASIDEVLPSCGSGKCAYAIDDGGKLTKIDPKNIRAYLLDCDFHENYFLIAPERVVETKMSDLLNRPFYSLKA